MIIMGNAVEEGKVLEKNKYLTVIENMTKV